MTEKQKCTALVTSGGGWHSFRCARNATHGDFCWQHSPAKVEERRKAADKRYQETFANSLAGRHEALKKEHEELLAKYNKLSIEYPTTLGYRYRTLTEEHEELLKKYGELLTENKRLTGDYETLMEKWERLTGAF